MNYVYLPFDVNRVPDGYRPVEAYEKDDVVIVPICDISEGQEHLHDCDVEGCGTLDHVVRFSLKNKYEAFDRIASLESDLKAATERAEKAELNFTMAKELYEGSFGILADTRTAIGLKQGDGICLVEYAGRLKSELAAIKSRIDGAGTVEVVVFDDGSKHVEITGDVSSGTFKLVESTPATAPTEVKP